MVTIVQVALDTTADPEVVVIPHVSTVGKHEAIRWTLIKNEDFKFAVLTPQSGALHDINRCDKEITATYDAPPEGKVDYTVEVYDKNGNKHTTIASGQIESGGGPTIRNN
jgi:hypothetical protein